MTTIECAACLDEVPAREATDIGYGDAVCRRCLATEVKTRADIGDPPLTIADWNITFS